MTEDVTASAFEGHVGSAFRLAIDGARTLTLTEVTRLSVQPGAPRPEPFSLLFTSDLVLEQGTYGLEHEELGELALFLVPLQPAPGGPSRYEAVFN